jgi:hypothetical protein
VVGCLFCSLISIVQWQGCWMFQPRNYHFQVQKVLAKFFLLLLNVSSGIILSLAVSFEIFYLARFYVSPGLSDFW